MKRAVPRFLVVLGSGGRAAWRLPDLAPRAMDGGADMVHVRERTQIVTRAETWPGTRLGVGRVRLDGLGQWRGGVAAELGANVHLPERADFNLLTDAARSKRRGLFDPLGDLPATAEQDYLLLGNLFETASKPGKPAWARRNSRKIA